MVGGGNGNVVGKPDGIFIDGSGNGSVLGNVVGNPDGKPDGIGKVGGSTLVSPGFVLAVGWAVAFPVVGGRTVPPFPVSSGAIAVSVDVGSVVVSTVFCAVVWVGVVAVSKGDAVGCGVSVDAPCD